MTLAGCCADQQELPPVLQASRQGRLGAGLPVSPLSQSFTICSVQGSNPLSLHQLCHLHPSCTMFMSMPEDAICC